VVGGVRVRGRRAQEARDALDLDAPVQRYVPSLPDKGHPITTRLLAGHLAGIRHYKDREFFLNRRFATVLDGLTIFQDDSLLVPPGTRFSYSSYAWNLVSAVVEGASGDDFLQYMSAHVFRPLGLTHTAPDRSDSLIPGRTQFYDRDSAGEETGYGIGWFLRTDSLGHRWAFHGGGSVGGTAVFGLDRDSGLVVAILTNLSDAPLHPAREIQAAFDR